MLKGYFRLGDIRVNLSGYEFADNFAFYMSCTQDSKRKIDLGIVVDGEDGFTVEPNWDNLYVSVGTINTQIPQRVFTEGGVTFKNSYNTQFFKIFGSLLRGFIKSCNTTNCVDVLGGFGGFNPSKTKTYEVVSLAGDITGTVQLTMGGLVELKAGGVDRPFELFLEEDYTSWLKLDKGKDRMIKIPLDLSDFIKKDDQLEWDNTGKLYSLAEIVEKNPDKNFQWIGGMDFEIVTDLKRVEEVCQEIWNHKGLVSFDTETTGLNFTFKCRQGEGDRLVGMVFSIKREQAWYFPIAHKKIKNICTDDNEGYIIDKYFKPLLEQKDLIGHNLSFDWKVMHVYGLDINVVHDTQIYYQVTLKNDNDIALGLKPLAKLLLDRDSLELHDFVGGKWGDSDLNFSDLPADSVKSYACPDVDNVLGIYEYGTVNGLLEMYGASKIYELEVLFSICIGYQEFYGHCTDMDEVEVLVGEIERDTSKAYAKMEEISGRSFNPASAKQVVEVMYEGLGYPVLGTTDTGNPSTDKDTLKLLIKEENPDGSLKYPFAKYLKDFKVSNQLRSNFTKKLPELATEDGFMFSSVNQFLNTGRVSVSDPNYQSYNDTVKKYIKPRQGFYMLDVDFSSVEYRILANMAGQENLIASFVDPDMDYHTYQASRMFSVPVDLVSKPLRGQAKSVNFGLAYGMGDPSLGRNIFGKITPANTKKASKLRKLYFEGQEKIQYFFKKAQDDGVNLGYSTTFFGRRRYFDKRKVKDNAIKRQAANNRIQGTAADLYKYSVVRLFLEMRKRGWVGLFLFSAFVHDELVAEVHKSIDPILAFSVLRECFMIKIDGWCDLYIGAGFGRSWYEAKKTEIPVQVQEIILEKYGETGLPFWDGDTSKLMEWEVHEINNYKRDRVLNAFKDPEKKGKVFVFESGLAHEILEQIKDGVDVEGVVTKDIEIKKDMIENLEQFAKAFGVMEDFLGCDPKRPDDIKHEVDEDDDVDIDEIDDDMEVDLFALCMINVKQQGVAYDSEKGKLYFRYDEEDLKLMEAVKGVIDRNSGSTEVQGVGKDGTLYNTGLCVDMKAYHRIFSLYAARRAS